MKNNSQTESTPAVVNLTTTAIKNAIWGNIDFLEMKKGKDAPCSAKEYASVLFLTLVDLGILSPEKLDDAMTIWNAFPKSPSAFRQLLEKEDKAEVSKQASGLLAKYSAKNLQA